MKIVFWGETKQCGTTSNMLAVAEMLAVMCPGARIEVRMPGVPQRSVRPCEGEKKIVSGESDDMKKIPAKKISAPKLSGEKFSSNKNQEMYFRFLDCGSGKDKWRRDMLRQADLVVVNLPQEDAALREFFLYDIHIAPNILILMGKYYELSRYGREYLERFYRIAPGTFGVVPCNAEFEMAAKQGKVRRFVQMESRTPENERNRELLQELVRFVELLLQNVEELQRRNEN